MVLHKIFGVERDIDIDAAVFPTPAELQTLEAPLGPHTHGWFDSCSNGVKLHTRTFWDKTTPPKAVVIFMHGVAGHGGEALDVNGRKTNVALIRQVLQGDDGKKNKNKNDIALHTFDLCGHGYSEGPRFFIPSFQENLNDYLTFIQLVDQEYDQKVPIFLMGMSYGGTLTIEASRSIQNDPQKVGPKIFAGALLYCPAVIGDLPPPAVYYTLRYVLAPLCPKWTPFFMPNPISPDRIWKDPEVLKRRRDPRSMEMRLGGDGEPFSLGTALALVTALDHCRTVAIPGFNVPFYLAHGTEDHGVKIEGSEYMWQTVDTPKEDRKLDYIEGGFHDLFSVPESQEYLERALQWIYQRLEKI